MDEIRLIDANALKKAIINDLGLGDEENGSDAEYMSGLQDCYNLIDNALTVEERQQGEWILQYRACGDEFYTCSLCERAIEVDYPQTLKDFPYCHCGAKMRGE